MKNDLSCGVVRDLLPSYVENLLGDESREAVERHLAQCPACSARKEAMAASPEPEETVREVNYLRRVKKGTTKKIVLAVVCTVLAVILGGSVKVFVIGKTPDPESISIERAQVDENNDLTLLADTYWGAYELRGLRASTKDGVLTYSAREVRTNIFQVLFRKEESVSKQVPLTIPLKGLREVWICGRLVWQEGMVITQECLDLLELRTPYCGDAPALGRIAEGLGLADRLGNYTIEIQTSKRPYRLTLHFEKAVSYSQQDDLTCCGCLFLALVDNLDSVCIDAPSAEEGEASVWSKELDLEAVNEAISKASGADGEWIGLTEIYNRSHGTSWESKASVKDYTNTPADLQRLLCILDFYYRER